MPPKRPPAPQKDKPLISATNSDNTALPSATAASLFIKNDAELKVAMEKFAAELNKDSDEEDPEIFNSKTGWFSLR